MSSSKSSGVTILNFDQGNIYVSKRLMDKLQNSNEVKPQEESKSTAQENQPKEKPATQFQMEKNSSNINDSFNDDFKSDGYRFESNSYEDSVTPPLKGKKDYFMKHSVFDTSNLLYEVRNDYEYKIQRMKRIFNDKFEKLDKLNNQLFKKNSEYFSKQVNKVNDTYFKEHFHYDTPCKEQESILKQCYQANLKKPLLCNQEVKQFAECVDKARMDYLKQKKSA